MSNINWNEKPEWADVWVEDSIDSKWSRWHRYCKDSNRYYDAERYYYSVNNKDITVHYPTETKPEWNGEGWPPVGLSVEVLHNGRWIGATTVGEFGDHKKCMVCAPDGGGFYGFYLHEIRPIKSDKEKWIQKAISCCDPDYGEIYDALVTGELPIPEVKK